MRWLAILLLCVACSSKPATPPSGPVDGAQAKTLVTNGAKLVDVRSPEEYAQGHIDNAENVPVDTVADHDFGDKSKALVLYCRSGRRSANAAATLRSKGYTQVYDLGAMDSWH